MLAADALRAWSSRPTFARAMVVGQLPVWFFAAAILTVTRVVLGTVDAREAELAAALAAGDLDPNQLAAIAAELRYAWMLSLVAIIGFSVFGTALTFWAYRHVARRVKTLVSFAEHRANGDAAAEPEPVGHDTLAMLERAIIRISNSVGERDEALRRETELSQFDARLQRALQLVDAEAQALNLVERALRIVVPKAPVQMLLADSSNSHLRPVLSLGCDGAGCTVDTPARCAAVRQGHTLRFASTDALDACPMALRPGRGPCSAVCAPIHVSGRSVGVLHIRGAANALPDDGRQAQIDGIATHAGVRLGMTRSLATSQLQAQTDP